MSASLFRTSLDWSKTIYGCAALVGTLMMSSVSAAESGNKSGTLRSPADTARGARSSASRAETPGPATGLDLRVPMALAARAIPPRLDPTQDYRPWFLLRGSNGIPVTPEHASWDLGDMTGRYLEALIFARSMGIAEPELSQAEARLQKYLFKILGPDGRVIDPQSKAVDHSFSQGSAMFGLLALFEDSGDPAVRRALQRLITGQLKACKQEGDMLIDPTVKLPESSGSHLAGYQIYPAISFYELTGYADALKLAEGLSRWALQDAVLGPDGAITKPLSWEGHIHSWFETLAGCARTARVSSSFDRAKVLARCRATYEWVRKTNGTSFGWFATYPSGGSCETCAISSAIRLALELAASGYPEYLNDVERFVRNQAVEAQFTDLAPFTTATNSPTPLMLGIFDSQSMPNCHLGTRGGEDVGTVEGCCLNGGMRALYLAWEAIQSANEKAITVNLALNRSGPACDVIGYQPFAGKVDVIPRYPAEVRVRLPSWADPETVTVFVDDEPARWTVDEHYAVIPSSSARAGARISLRYPLRQFSEIAIAGGQKFDITWKGDVVTAVSPPGKRDPAYVGRDIPATNPFPLQPDTWFLQDAARLAGCSMLARMDLEREGQPFFRIYPFADPPRAEHERWDDGDMTGRYVEALILARRISGIPMDARETQLRNYLMKLFDLADGLCYTPKTDWTPRRACLFSQSSAMLGLLGWYRETGAPEALKLMEWQFEGLTRIATNRTNSAYFPKYEFDGKQFVDEPKDKDAPPWYGGRLILPLVELWKITGRDDIKLFITKLVNHVTRVSTFIGPNGEVEQGEGWWGHLHGTSDMVAGVAEFGRVTNQPELVQWARRVYDWVGRTHVTRYGWVADVSGGRIHESCGVASRFRLGLALYKAGAADPFGDMDRYLRNQLLENQFVDTSFMAQMKPATPRTSRAVYANIDKMIRGTFQCWGTANDLIGNDDIEGCGAGGGVQALALALEDQSEWLTTSSGEELRVHLLFNRMLRARPEPPFTNAAPVAAELWSWLPTEGRASLRAHQPIARVALRIPDGAEQSAAHIRRSVGGRVIEELTPRLDRRYALVDKVQTGETIELTFPLREFDTTETAAGRAYRIHWRGDYVTSIDPPGDRIPLYSRRSATPASTPLIAPRYP